MGESDNSKVQNNAVILHTNIGANIPQWWDAKYGGDSNEESTKTETGTAQFNEEKSSKLNFF